MNDETIIIPGTVVIDLERNPGTVVNKVTASHGIRHGSSSASNDLETIITQCSVDVACSEKRGFQHVYKNSKKPSTRRVQEAYEQSVRNCHLR